MGLDTAGTVDDMSVWDRGVVIPSTLVEVSARPVSCTYGIGVKEVEQTTSQVIAYTKHSTGVLSIIALMSSAVSTQTHNTRHYTRHYIIIGRRKYAFCK